MDAEQSTPPTPPRGATPSATAPSMGVAPGGAAGGMMGMGQNVNQGMQGHFQQPGNVQTPSQFLPGRLTPQGIQQGKKLHSVLYETVLITCVVVCQLWYILQH